MGSVECSTAALIYSPLVCVCWCCPRLVLLFNRAAGTDSRKLWVLSCLHVLDAGGVKSSPTFKSYYHSQGFGVRLLSRRILVYQRVASAVHNGRYDGLHAAYCVVIRIAFLEKFYG